MSPFTRWESKLDRIRALASSGVLKWAVGSLVFLGVGCSTDSAPRSGLVPGTNSIPAAFTGSGQGSPTAEWQVARPGGEPVGARWWEQFGDPELNRLEVLAGSGNLELVEAVARMEASRAAWQVARADLFPHLSLAPGYMRQRTSENAPERGRAAGVSHTFGSWVLPLDAGWELDLWGRVRGQAAAMRSRWEALEGDLAMLRLSVTCEVAVQYGAYRTVEQELRILGRSLAAYEAALELTRNRRRGGIATDLDVSQAELQLRSAQALVPGMEARKVRLQHALAVLCGRMATGFAVPACSNPDPGLECVLPGLGRVSWPLGIPSEILERRPDVAAAERRMAAANAEVGVARVAYYPKVRLNGVAGLQSVDASTFFDWPSRLWAVGPSVEFPLFTGGRRKAVRAAAEAGHAEAVAAYQRTVLRAFQEVEDRLSADQWLAEQGRIERLALASARRVEQLAMNRYRAGLVTYLEVATAQGSALTRERAVLEIESERWLSGIALVKALGGPAWK